jgi:hypothetical protein
MAENKLTKDGEFVVKDEKVLLYILALLFFGIFMYGVIDAISRQFKNIDYQSFVFSFALIPAYFLFKRGRSNKVYIRINKKGIYQDEKLITGWPAFLNAYITQQEKKKIYDLRDNFILVVEYWKIDPKQGFRHKIPLTNTQNKSEEDVLEAVTFFWKEYKKGSGIIS